MLKILRRSSRSISFLCAHQPIQNRTNFPRPISSRKHPISNNFFISHYINNDGNILRNIRCISNGIINRIENKLGGKRSVIINDINENELEESAKILTKTFIEDEAIRIYTKTPFNKQYDSTYKYLLQAIQNRTAFCARDIENELIIGVGLATNFTEKYSLKYINEEETKSLQGGNLDNTSYVIWRKYFGLFQQEFGIGTKILVLQMAGVLKAYQGFGIGNLLIKKRIEKGKELGFQLALIEANNIFSLKAAQSVGFKAVSYVDYESHKVIDPNTQEEIFPLKNVNLMERSRIMKLTGKYIQDPCLGLTLLAKKL